MGQKTYGGLNGWHVALIAAFCLGVYFLSMRAADKWGRTRAYKSIAIAFGFLPFGAMIAASSLMLRVRITQGYWAQTGKRWAVVGDPAEVVYTGHPTYGFDNHYLFAQAMCLVAIASIAVCGPFFLAQLNRGRRPIKLPILFGISWTLLVLMRTVDPGDQFHWLVPM